MKNLKTLRENANLTQKQLAQKMNLAPANIGFYELGKTEPSVGNLIKLANFFGCSIDYLLGHETQGIVHLDSFTPLQQKLIPMIQRLNESQTNYLLGWCSSALGIPYDDVKPTRPW